MNAKKHWALTLLMSAPVGLALIASVSANGGPGSGRGGLRGIPPSRAGHPVGVLRELIYPCPAACNEIAKDCNETADTAALACVSDACPTEITAAQTACADDSRSDACQTAVTALRTCAATCLDTRATAITACRTALRTCADACDGDSEQ